KEMLLKISSSLGGGFGRQRLICGAINSGGLILGGYLNNGKEESKEDQYKIIKEFTDKFNELNNTIICGELLKNVKNLTQGIKPQQRNEEYYKLRPCAKFVVDAIEIIINIINNNTVNI
ncbi:MAG: C-GCAxxG-C-C family protein, partial [Clostridia bacterium]